MSASEPVSMIDDQDNVIGVTTREEASRRDLPLRVAGVLIQDSTGRLVVQQRSREKKHPLCWDYSAAGHVLAGEGYGEAAERELAEELGISARLEMIGILRMNDPVTQKLKKVHHVYAGVHDGPYRPFAGEVSAVRALEVRELSWWMGGSPAEFTPTFIKVFATFVEPLLVSQTRFLLQVKR